MSKKRTYFHESPNKQELYKNLIKARSDSRLQITKQSNSNFFNQNQQPSHFKKYISNDQKKLIGSHINRDYELQNDQENPNYSILGSQQQKRLQKNLMDQIKAARDDIWRYQNYLKEANNHLGGSSQFSIRTQLEQILQLEKNIKIRDQQIKEITSEIKILKSKPRNTNLSSQGSIIAEKNYINPIQLLTKQINQARIQLKQAQRMHAQKTFDFQKKRDHVKKIENQYIQICLTNDQKPLTFQQFKQKRRENAIKELSKTQLLKSKFSNTKNFGWVKTKINQNSNSKIQETQFSNMGYNIIPSTNLIQKPKKKPSDFQKRIYQLQNKRQIAEKALKNSQRKHQNQIKELMAKIEFLADQKQILDAKIEEKSKQMQFAQTKFAEAKRKGQGIRKPKSLKNFDLNKKF